MHLRSGGNHGQLMMVNSVSPSCLDAPLRGHANRTILLRKALHRISETILLLSLATTSSHASSHPSEYPVAALDRRLFAPLPLLAALQCP
jgi:hypothetical protein